MCDERERLIGYVYDECDPAERRAIDEHLQACHTCRGEIGALRKVRQDLLAWDVPEHTPVWRPLAPPRAKSAWGEIPAWAMAAAAAVLLVVGAAGGAVTYAFLPHANAPVVAAATAPDPEVAALSQRVAELEKARDEVARVTASAPDRDASSSSVSQVVAAQNDLARQVRAIAQRQDDMDRDLMRTTLDTAGMVQRQRGLLQLTKLGQQYSSGSGIGGAR
jgi:hypothetical protein